VPLAGAGAERSLWRSVASTADFNLAARTRSRRTEVGVCLPLYHCVLFGMCVKLTPSPDQKFMKLAPRVTGTKITESVFN
jgi:hypothetical protein